MYATVRTYSGGSEFVDALVARQDDIRSVITAIDGFRAYYLVRTAGGATTISVFANQDGAQESTSAAAAWVAANIPDVSPGPPQVTGGEVALSF
ncbi:MAG TPA: hypothetical protein VFB35_05770 [Gaiellaceae bacterium]|nr:hypothetical protein [Gaiellaceae bacterium]